MFFVPLMTADTSHLERQVDLSTDQRQMMFYACPNGDDPEWAELRDTLECNRVPCACRVAMANQKQQSSPTPRQLDGVVCVTKIGGDASPARNAMTDLMVVLRTLFRRK